MGNTPLRSTTEQPRRRRMVTRRRAQIDDTCIDNHLLGVYVEHMHGQFKGDQVFLDKALPFLIHACYQQLRSLTYREFLTEGLEITPEQWIVLVRLWTQDGQSQSALSESTLRDRPTMSRILDTMEKGGLVQRCVDGADARSRLIQLTRKGKALQPRLVPVAKKLVARLEHDIPERDLEVTHRTLGRMLQNLR